MIPTLIVSFDEVAKIIDKDGKICNFPSAEEAFSVWMLATPGPRIEHVHYRRMTDDEYWRTHGRRVDD